MQPKYIASVDPVPGTDPLMSFRVVFVDFSTDYPVVLADQNKKKRIRRKQTNKHGK
jgi:hypothetical protein